VLRDLLLACRTLLSSPALVLVSVLSLGLGVGVNLALVGAIRAVFFYTPSVVEPGSLVGVQAGNSNQYSYLNYRDLHESGIFAAVAGYRPVQLNARTADGVERIGGLAVTSDFFRTLGIAALHGRVWQPEEAAAEREPRLVVLTHGYWQRRFAADPAVAGRAITLNGEPFTVVGVLPPDHRAISGLLAPDVFAPLSTSVFPTIDDRSNGNALFVLGRLHTGGTREGAQAAVTALGQRLEAEYPQDNEGMGQPATVLPLWTREFGGWQEPLLLSSLLFALVGLVLLSACANVAGLLLARAVQRQRELTVRVALGAHRAALMRMMLAESMVLALLGSLAGGVLFLWLTTGMSAVTLPNGRGAIPLWLQLDGALIAYALALAAATGLLCGVVPALRAARANVASEIKSGDTHQVTGRLWLRHSFVVGQVAVSLMLLVLASLLLRSLARITTLDPGFDLDRVAIARVHVPPARYLDDGGLPLGERIVEALRTVPGVEAASFTNIVALGTETSATRLQVDGRAEREPGARAYLNSVSPGYFETLGIPFVAGRDFDTRDRPGTPPVAIVSEAFARAYFPGTSALGQRVRRAPREPFAEIVGVVRDSKYESVAEPATPLFYTSYTQVPRVSTQIRPLVVHARSTGAASAIVAELRRVVGQLDPAVAVEVETLRQATGSEAALRTLGVRLIGTLAVVALLLAMMGLYGVTAFVVSSRTPEIGTRMALGANAGQILRQVLGDGLRLVAIGVGIGAAAAWLVARALVAALAGLSPADPAAFGGAGAVLLLVALAASYLPARRAARLDPVTALRVN
jgi:putative ABC transport system permease protein